MPEQPNKNSGSSLGSFFSRRLMRKMTPRFLISKASKSSLKFANNNCSSCQGPRIAECFSPVNQKKTNYRSADYLAPKIGSLAINSSD